jgi:hypothetical protein
MNMIVVNKNNDKQYTVYDITYDKSGYPHFLLYKDGQWVRMSAKYFRPFSTDDVLKALNSISNPYTLSLSNP